MGPQQIEAEFTGVLSGPSGLGEIGAKFTGVVWDPLAPWIRSEIEAKFAGVLLGSLGPSGN